MINYQELLSRKVKQMRPSGIRKFFDLASEMPNCISLGVGEPDFKTPWEIREMAIRTLEKGKTKYTSNAGLNPLRNEITTFLKRKYNLDYDTNQILVTVGGSEAIDLAIRALINPNDEVIIPEPCFVCYEPITTLTGGIPISIQTKQEDKFRLKADDLRKAITPKTKLLILPYPNNPTGAILEKNDLLEIYEVLKDTNILVLSDEIYSELTYTSLPHISIASINDMIERTILINGFSKTYAMTGWRLGYAAGPNEIIKAMTKIHQSAIMSAPTISQYAAITALKDSDNDIINMRNEYNMRRRLVVSRLNKMGLDTFMPEGAFYVFPSIKKTNLSSEEFCERLLKEKEVAIIPGNAFGKYGEGYVRISYAYSIDHLEKALDRIEDFINAL